MQATHRSGSHFSTFELAMTTLRLAQMFAGHCHIDGPAAEKCDERVACSDGEQIPGELDETNDPNEAERWAG
jgi:hypothetical protein